MKKMTRLTLLSVAALLAVVGSNGAAPQPTVHADGVVPPLAVTGVEADNSSAKIDFSLVAGAKDYRVFDVSDPSVVKYAGLAQLATIPWCNCHFAVQPDGITPVYPITTTTQGSGPTSLSVPSTEIEWNRLSDGQPHTLVVQAVDQLGPTPPGNLYDGGNNPLTMPMPAGAMLGSDEGTTPDGNTSINGQGPYTDTPQVIAQSAPFVVQAAPAAQAIPSRPDVTQSFFDTFDDSEAASLRQVGPVDPVQGVMTYTLNAGTPKAWTIQYLGADTRDSMPVVEDGHFMDTLFDGGTPGTSIPLHNNHAVMAMSPDQTADLSGGKLLHLTMEVDAHEDSRRWTAFNLAPATDPLTNWYTVASPINNTDTAFFGQIFPGGFTTDLYTGPVSATDPAPKDVPISGALGQAPVWGYRSLHWGGNGLNLDNRSRFDLFLTTTHFALFEDGQFVLQADIPGGLSFDQAKVYFTHYLYHTSNDHPELMTYSPSETYWINEVPWSDERHWDNMGFEILPASAVPTDWTTLASLISMPASAAPQMAPATVTATPLPPTATNTPLPPTATNTPLPPTATNTSVPPAVTRTPVPPTATTTPTPVPPTATNTPVPAPTVAPTCLHQHGHSSCKNATTSASIVLGTSTTGRTLSPRSTGTSSGLRLALQKVAASAPVVHPGGIEAFTAGVTSNKPLADARLQFAVYNAHGTRVWQAVRSRVAVRPGKGALVRAAWRVPRSNAPGVYTLKLVLSTRRLTHQAAQKAAARFAVAQLQGKAGRHSAAAHDAPA